MKIKKGFVVRQVGEQYVVAPVGEMGKTFRGVITFNESGNFLWNFFSNERTEDEAVAALCQFYEVGESIAREDVQQFMRFIEKQGFTE